MPKEIKIAGLTIAPGETKTTQLKVGRLYDYTQMSIPIRISRGKKDGPMLFISAAIHGDEIVGSEVIKRILAHPALKTLAGTLITVPIVNVYGFNRLSRYLPDRRDLNRCFPGNKNGSLAARMAHTFFSEVASRCDYGIDLHSGAIHRTNLPQIRACLDGKVVKKLARAFHVPVIVNSSLRDGSLRQALEDKSIPILLFEGGEALRIDEKVVQSAVNGTLSVMREVGMIKRTVKSKKRQVPTFIANSTYWMRAPRSGMVTMNCKLGQRVAKGTVLAHISDPFGEEREKVIAKSTGIIIGVNQLPLVSQGDALVHIATFDDAKKVETVIEEDTLMLQD